MSSEFEPQLYSYLSTQSSLLSCFTSAKAIGVRCRDADVSPARRERPADAVERSAAATHIAFRTPSTYPGANGALDLRQ